MAFASKSKSHGKPEGAGKSASGRKADHAQRSTDSRAGFETLVFQPLTSGILQRKCACGGATGMSGGCEECKTKRMLGIQTKLTIGEPGDRFEQEADHVADRVMRMPDRSTDERELSFSSATVQRKGAASDHEDKTLQRKEGGEPLQMKPLSHAITPMVGAYSEPGAETASGLETGEARAIEERRGGMPLPESVRNYMEPRFGADFGAVRLHSGREAAQLNERLHSQAFTYGRNIWLGEGQSRSNLPLLAHELTHVLQQSPSLMRSPKPMPIDGEVHPRIQRSNDYFALPDDFHGKVPGERSHQYVFAGLAAEKENSGMFFEVAIPGANKGGVATHGADENYIRGFADFYKADTNNTTIGVAFGGDDPEPFYLPSKAGWQLRQASGKVEKNPLNTFKHAELAAPVGKKPAPTKSAGIESKLPLAVASSCPLLKSPAICRLDSAPKGIALGELKSVATWERAEGGRQLDNYIKGIEETADKVNDFGRKNPDKIDPKNSSWSPAPRKLTNLKIPPKFVYPSSEGKPQEVFNYRNGIAKPYSHEMPKVAARVYVVKDTDNDGVWYYEWCPIEPVKKDVKSLKQAQEDTSQKLTPLIVELKTEPKLSGKRKPGAGARPIASSTRFRLQRRVTDPFRLKNWQPKFETWREKQAKPYLKTAEARDVEFLDTLLQIKKRSFQNLEVPPTSAEVTGPHRKIEHWEEHGKTYGRLRATFKGVYLRVLGFYERARHWLQKAFKRDRGGHGFGFKGTIISIGLRVLRSAAHVLMSRVAGELVNSFKGAVTNVINDLFKDQIEEATAHIDKVKEYIKDFETLVATEITQELQSIIQKYQSKIEVVRQGIDIAGKVMKALNIGKGIATLASCTNLLRCAGGMFFGMLSDLALAHYMGSCDFREKYILPVIRAVGLEGVAKNVGEWIVEKLKNLLPGRAKELVGKVPAPTLSGFDPCVEAPDEPSSPGVQSMPETPLDHAYNDLYDKYGTELVGAVSVLLEKMGVPDDREADIEGIKRIDEFLEKTGWTVNQILNYAFSRKPPTKAISIDEALDFVELGIQTQAPNLKPRLPVDVPGPIQPPDDPFRLDPRKGGGKTGERTKEPPQRLEYERRF